MTQIGKFLRNAHGVYSGEIRTLTLQVEVTISPCERDNDKAPDHRVISGEIELGHGWSRTNRESGLEYLSLKLDDPLFPGPVYATLTADDGQYVLAWSR
jgi:uncharacterized protein (DUF736 family)